MNVDVLPYTIVDSLINNAPASVRRALSVTSKQFANAIFFSGRGTLHTHLIVEYFRTTNTTHNTSADDILLHNINARLTRTRYILLE